MTTYNELDPKEIVQAYKYYHFILWISEQGYEPYTDEEIFINKERQVATVYWLWWQYTLTWPEHIKDKI